MRFQSIIFFTLTSVSSAAAFATGYSGPGFQPVTTVQAAMGAADDTPVVLQGKIIKRIQGDIYEFRDATGVMKVEIDDEDWPAATIDLFTPVKLTGEVDRDLIGREIDVEFVELIAQ